MRSLGLLLGVLALFVAVLPVSADTGGPDDFGYIWRDNVGSGGPTFNWVDTSGGVAVGLLNQDDAVVTHALPFSFPYYGEMIDEITICSNGWVACTTGIYSYLSGYPVPSASNPEKSIMAFLDDLSIRGGSDVIFKSYNEGGIEKAAIIWERVNCPYSISTDFITFEIILEQTGRIVFQYRSLDTPTTPDRGHGSSATIGIQNGDGTVGLGYSSDAAILTDERVIEFLTDSSVTITNAALAALIAPAAVVDSGVPVVPTVLYRNRGTVEVPSQDVICRILDEASTELYSRTLTAAPLLVSAQETLRFPEWPALVNGNYTVICSLTNADDRSTDNVIRLTFRVGAIRDAGVSFIVSPISGLYPDSNVTPAVVVINGGEVALTDRTLVCVIKDNAGFEIYRDTQHSGLIALGAQDTVRFTPTIFREAGIDTVMFYLVERDNNPYNDTLRSAFEVVGHINEGGPDAYGHWWADVTSPSGPVYEYVDIHTTGTVLTGVTGDDSGQNFLLPWTFSFYGEDRHAARVCTNGWMAFDTTYTNTYSNTTLPDPNLPHDAIYVYWDDLYVTATTAGVYWESRGTAPNRQLIVQWYNIAALSGTAMMGDFEIILNESDNSIVLLYQSVALATYNARAVSATIGIENATSTDGIAYISNGIPLGQQFDGPFGIKFVEGGLIDRAAPQIRHTPMADTWDRVGPYVVQARITDQTGIRSDSLYYRISGGPWHAVTHDSTTAPNFFFSIPGAAGGSAIDYYLAATDITDSLYRGTFPANAPTTYLTFTILDDTHPPVIRHDASDLIIFGDHVILTATINDDNPMSSDSVVYWLAGAGPMVVAEQSHEGNLYTYWIGGIHIGDSLRYYFVATDASDHHNRVTLPADAPTSTYACVIREAHHGGPDGFGYEFWTSFHLRGPEYDWLEISPEEGGSGYPISFVNMDDAISTPFDLDEAFNYYGSNQTAVRICTNGWLSFNLDETLAVRTTVAIPDTAEPNLILAPWFTNLALTASIPGSGVYSYYDITTRSTIIEWYKVLPGGGSTPLSFQIVLQHRTGDILYRYQRIVSADSSGIVGIEDGTGQRGLQVFSHGRPAGAGLMADSMAIRFSIHGAGVAASGMNAGRTPLTVRPNPTTGAVTISGLPHNRSCRVEVVDLFGHAIATFEGTDAVLWDGSRTDGLQAPAGVYLIRADGQTARVVRTE